MDQLYANNKVQSLYRENVVHPHNSQLQTNYIFMSVLHYTSHVSISLFGITIHYNILHNLRCFVHNKSNNENISNDLLTQLAIIDVELTITTTYICQPDNGHWQWPLFAYIIYIPQVHNLHYAKCKRPSLHNRHLINVLTIRTMKHILNSRTEKKNHQNCYK